jgi:hypothetical protein
MRYRIGIFMILTYTEYSLLKKYIGYVMCVYDFQRAPLVSGKLECAIFLTDGLLNYCNRF